MIRGLYSAADGLLVQAARIDVISGNLAGASVAGYRRDVPFVRAFTRTLEYAAAEGAAGVVGDQVLVAPGTWVDLTPGALRHTGGDFDVALEGPGYFCVETRSGEAYTRGGALRLDGSGVIVTAGGDPVLGRAGPIRIAGGEVEFSENGDVLVDGARVDRLKLADLAPGVAVEKLGGGLLRADAALVRAAADVRVRQGYLETANVDVIGEMAGMISALRAFEASQRALQANDETLAKAINEIARV